MANTVIYVGLANVFLFRYKTLLFTPNIVHWIRIFICYSVSLGEGIGSFKLYLNGVNGDK